MIKDHPAFLPPPSSCTLWRYMDLTKLLSLLESRQIYFARLDQFEDPYEGRLPAATVAALRDYAEEQNLPNEYVESTLSGSDTIRQDMYVSCWCMHQHESAAMWKIYLQSPEGVAIRTDHQALCAALERSPISVRTSVVSYVDYDNAIVPVNNSFYRILHKRLSFAHECELRAVIWSFEDINAPLIPRGSPFASIDIEPSALIHAVYVSPTAPDWFGVLVERLLARYGLSCLVERSKLYERPTY